MLRNGLWLLAATTAAAAWTPLASQAQGLIRAEINSRSGYTAGQWALLPEWCRFTQDNPVNGHEGWDRVTEAQKWIGVIGPDMVHMHHYCRGLRYELLLGSIADLNPRERTALNERITEEMTYIIKNCRPQMPLMPEVFLKKGEAHLRMEQLTLAQEAFDVSRSLKPDYWPAYTRWADVLIRLKQFERARALLEQGLVHAPNQPQLIERLRQAGGRVAAAGTGAAPGVGPAAAPAASAP